MPVTICHPPFYSYATLPFYADWLGCWMHTALLSFLSGKKSHGCALNLTEPCRLLQTSRPFSLGQRTEMLKCWVPAPLLTFYLEMEVSGLCTFFESRRSMQAAESHPTLFLGECTGKLRGWVPAPLSLLPGGEIEVLCSFSQSGRAGQAAGNLTPFLCSLLPFRGCFYPSVM